jgi:hypothetical protein
MGKARIEKCVLFLFPKGILELSEEKSVIKKYPGT